MIVDGRFGVQKLVPRLMCGILEEAKFVATAVEGRVCVEDLLALDRFLARFFA